MTTATPTDTERERRRQAAHRKLKNHSTWVWSLIATLDPWTECVPWPLLMAVPGKSKEKESRGSVWLSCALALSAYLIYYSGGSLERDGRYAADAARTLFTGAFLLGTLLSVTNTVAGPAIRRSAKNDANVVLVVGGAFAWGVLLGLIGGAALMFYPSFVLPAQWLAIFLGVYGGLMELNAMLFTLRLALLSWVEKPGAESTPAPTPSAPGTEPLQDGHQRVHQ